MKSKYDSAYVILNNSISKGKQEIWKNKKIVIAGMTKCIEAVYTEEPLGIGVGAYAIYDFNGYDPYYILGILNSRITTYFLIKEFSDKHLAGGYLAINKSTIEQFRMPSSNNEAIKKLISNKAKIINDKKRSNPLTDTTAEEREIDRLVYDLYGLTEEEIAIVEGTN